MNPLSGGQGDRSDKSRSVLWRLRAPFFASVAESLAAGSRSRRARDSAIVPGAGRGELRAMLLATLQAPLQNFVVLLAAPAQNFAYLLAAKERQGDSTK